MAERSALVQPRGVSGWFLQDIPSYSVNHQVCVDAPGDVLITSDVIRDQRVVQVQRCICRRCSCAVLICC